MTDGWSYHQLQDLVEPDSPISYGVVKPGEEGDIPFVRGGDLSDGKVLQSRLRTITREVSDQYRRTLLRGGELLICLVGQPGQVGVAPPSLNGANIARQVGLVRLLGIVASDFVSYFLRSPQGQKQLGSYAGGSVQQVINLVDLRKVLVPVPPLPEQQRIVALLDEAFAGLATAKANAERNLQNARSIFESHLAATFSQLGDDWAEMSLEAVVDPSCTLSYGIVQPGEDYLDGLPIVRPTDLAAKVIHLDGLKRIDPRLADGYKRTTLQGGELLLCVRGSTGVVSIAAPELRGANVTRGIVPVRFNSALLLPELGYYLLKSEYVQSQIREKTYGAALMQINIRDLRAITLFVPTLKEQSVIALAMSELDADVQRLTHLYERKLAALGELKKSLLQQAFNGEL